MQLSLAQLLPTCTCLFTPFLLLLLPTLEVSCFTSSYAVLSLLLQALVLLSRLCSALFSSWPRHCFITTHLSCYSPCLSLLCESLPALTRKALVLFCPSIVFDCFRLLYVLRYYCTIQTVPMSLQELYPSYPFNRVIQL